jgi:hypothetical protein
LGFEAPRLGRPLPDGVGRAVRDLGHQQRRADQPFPAPSVTRGEENGLRGITVSSGWFETSPSRCCPAKASRFADRLVASPLDKSHTDQYDPSKPPSRSADSSPDHDAPLRMALGAKGPSIRSTRMRSRHAPLRPSAHRKVKSAARIAGKLHDGLFHFLGFFRAQALTVGTPTYRRIVPGFRVVARSAVTD